jgi:hypothetical protein
LRVEGRKGFYIFRMQYGGGSFGSFRESLVGQAGSNDQGNNRQIGLMSVRVVIITFSYF